MITTSIAGTAAIWLNTLSIAVILFTLANIAVSVVVSLLAQRFFALEVKSRQSILWFLVLAPWFVGLLASGYFDHETVSTSPFNAHIDYAHWHHMDTFAVFSWHALSLLLAAVAVITILVKKVRLLIKHKRDLAALHHLASPIDKDTYQLDAPQASAFTSGFITRRCYITSGMLNATTVQEQAVILGHEKAHANQYDPLKKWLFSIFAAFFVPPLSNRLKLHMTLAMEQSADNTVSKGDMPPTFVAATLLKVARLNAQAKPVVNPALVASFGADVLEQRVYFLLGHLQLKPINKLLSMVFFVVILTICLSSIDNVHHIMETVFSH